MDYIYGTHPRDWVLIAIAYIVVAWLIWRTTGDRA